MEPLGILLGLADGVGRHPTNSIGWVSAMESNEKDCLILDLHMCNSWSALSRIIKSQLLAQNSQVLRSTAVGHENLLNISPILSTFIFATIHLALGPDYLQCLSKTRMQHYMWMKM